MALQLEIMYNEIEIITRSGSLLFASFPRSLSYYFSLLDQFLEFLTRSGEDIDSYIDLNTSTMDNRDTAQ